MAASQMSYLIQFEYLRIDINVPEYRFVPALRNYNHTSSEYKVT